MKKLFMTKNTKPNILLTILAIFASLVFLIAIGSIVYFFLSFGMRQNVSYKDCGNQTYIIFNDFEGARIMHNTNNEKMNKAGNDIITRYETLGITSTLKISNKDKGGYAVFIPENNKLEDWELSNLVECYPESEMVLRTDIRRVEKEPNHFYQESDEEKLR